MIYFWKLQEVIISLEITFKQIWICVSSRILHTHVKNIYPYFKWRFLTHFSFIKEDYIGIPATYKSIENSNSTSFSVETRYSVNIKLWY